MLGAEPERGQSDHWRSSCNYSGCIYKRGELMTGMTRKIDIGDLRFLYDLSIYNCLKFGPYKALIYEDGEEVREYTNREIAKEAAQLAAGLRMLGIEKGDRVIVMMLNCPEVIISYQAIARAGGIIIPVLPLLKGPEVCYIAENSAAKV